jgi:hypothetical protein
MNNAAAPTRLASGRYAEIPAKPHGIGPEK